MEVEVFQQIQGGQQIDLVENEIKPNNRTDQELTPFATILEIRKLRSAGFPESAGNLNHESGPPPLPAKPTPATLHLDTEHKA